MELGVDIEWAIFVICQDINKVYFPEYYIT